MAPHLRRRPPPLPCHRQPPLLSISSKSRLAARHMHPLQRRLWLPSSSPVQRLRVLVSLLCNSCAMGAEVAAMRGLSELQQ